MNSKRRKITEEHKSLYITIPKGRNNACRGCNLALLMGVDERTIRQMIEDLTVSGYTVCNLQNGKGYYRPETEEDIEAMLNLTASRAHSLLRKKYALKKSLERFKYGGNSLFAQDPKPNVQKI